MKRINSYTMANRRSSRTHILGFGYAFTMAEILISLTIIGVIAALTLPALMANLNEKVWNTKRKALHSRMAQALAAMPNLDKYQDADGHKADYNFIQNGLATTLNITKVCPNNDMSKCDFAMPERAMNDEVFDSPWDSVPSFNTINGESIGVIYNPSCRGESNADFLTTLDANNMMCAGFIYDLNGASKGPNKVGKDMGLIAAYFPEYPLVVAPMPVVATEDTVSADDMEDLFASNSEYRLPSSAEATVLSNLGTFIGQDYAKEVIWTDNDFICDGATCDKAGVNDMPDKAFFILVSKNGDAPKTFKIIENGKEEEQEGCSQHNTSACNTKEACEGAGFTWNDQYGSCTIFQVVPPHSPW